MKIVRQAFKQFDTDNDGAITRQEVIQGMKVSGRNFSSEEIDTLFVLADRDGDGQIDFPEFALIMIPTAPERIAKLKRKFKNKGYNKLRVYTEDIIIQSWWFVVWIMSKTLVNS